MFRKAIFLLSAFFLITSCAGGWDSVKRGLTGQKKNSTDELLVEKKDPLILPPDYENLPAPSASISEEEKIEIESFEKSLGSISNEGVEDDSGSSSEESILKQIRKK